MDSYCINTKVLHASSFFHCLSLTQSIFSLKKWMMLKVASDSSYVCFELVMDWFKMCIVG
jgi:hypothetical protein